MIVKFWKIMFIKHQNFVVGLSIFTYGIMCWELFKCLEESKIQVNKAFIRILWYLFQINHSQLISSDRCLSLHFLRKHFCVKE